MVAEFERRWAQLAQEVLSGMRDWRVQHPTATFAEIEEELDTRMARMRAGLLEDLAMASAAADVGGSQERPRCPTCGGELQERGKHVRKLTTQGDQTVQLRRSYGYCPTCQVGFFPAFMSNWGCEVRWRHAKVGRKYGPFGDMDAVSSC